MPKMHQVSLAAGLCPDPLGSLSTSPDPLDTIGATSRRGREGSLILTGGWEMEGGNERDKKGRKEKGRGKGGRK